MTEIEQLKQRVAELERAVVALTNTVRPPVLGQRYWQHFPHYYDHSKDIGSPPDKRFQSSATSGTGKFWWEAADDQ